MWQTNLFVTFFLFSLFVSSLSLTNAASVYVRSTDSSDSGSCTQDSPCATIVQALGLLPDDSSSHTVVLMLSSQALTGSGNGGLTPEQIGGSSLSRQVTFQGDTSGSPTLVDLGYQRRFAAVAAALKVNFDNLHLINGRTEVDDPYRSFGGFIMVDNGATVTLSNSKLENAWCDGFYEDSQGGAIYCGDGSVSISSCYFNNNSAGVGGTLSMRKKSVGYITSSEMTASFSHTGGWAGTMLTEDDSTTVVEDTWFHDNVILDTYGAVLDDGTRSNTTFRRCLFERNIGFAGGVYYSYGSSTSRWEDCIMRDNGVVGTDSGTMSLTSASTVTVIGCTISGSSGDGILGTVLVTGSALATFTNTLFANNSAGIGGAIAYNSDQPLTITNCSFEDNIATSYGGAISVSQPLPVDGDYTLLVRNSTFSGNQGSSQGGAFQIDSSLLDGVVPVILDQVTLEANSATDGGALHVSGSGLVWAEHVDLIDNIADRDGGAALLTDNALLTLVDAQLQGNSAFAGGALWLSGSATATVYGSRFASNSGFLGGTIYLSSSSGLNISYSDLSSNTALVGAALYLDQDASAERCFACGPSMSFVDNVASRAGPALYWVIRSSLQTDACSPNPQACPESTTNFTGNVAKGYGGNIATSPSHIEDFQVTASSSSPIFPGTTLEISGLIKDDLNQTVVSASEVLELDLIVLSVSPGNLMTDPVIINGASNFLASDTGRFSNSFELAVDYNSLWNSSLSNSSKTLKSDSTTFNVTMRLSGFPATLEPVHFSQELDPQCPSSYVSVRLPNSVFSICLEEVKIPEGGQIGLGIGLGLALLLAVALGIWQLFKRDDPVVRAGSPFLTSVITFGLALSLIAGYMWFASVDGLCALRPWLLGIGMSLVYACLVVKQWRLKFIFDRAANFRKAELDTARVMACVVAIQLLPTLIILIVWFAISPYVQKVDIDWENLTYSELCGSDSQTLDTVMISLLLALNALVMFMGVVLSLISGNIFSNYNEASYLGLCMYALGIALAIVTPLVIIYANDVVVQFFVPVVAILVVATVTLLIIYGQKLFVIYFPEHASLRLNQEIGDVTQKITFFQQSS